VTAGVLEDEEPGKRKLGRAPKSLHSITVPILGEIYLGCWCPCFSGIPSARYAVVVLPIGEFNVVAISRSISKATLLKGRVPICCQVDRSPRSILGCSEVFEDGGPDAARRDSPSCTSTMIT
jgi:hypothetical protein